MYGRSNKQTDLIMLSDPDWTDLVETYFLTMLSLNVWLSTLHETVKVQLQWVKLIPNQTRVHHILVKQKLPGASLGYKWRKNRLGYYYGSSVEYGIKI